MLPGSSFARAPHLCLIFSYNTSINSKNYNAREHYKRKYLFLGVELRDGGDLDGLDRKSSTYNSVRIHRHFAQRRSNLVCPDRRAVAHWDLRQRRWHMVGVNIFEPALTI